MNVRLFNFHEAGASVHSGCELSDELTEPHGTSSLLIICKSWNGGHCAAPSSSCRFAHKCSGCFGLHCVGACPAEPPSPSQSDCSLSCVHPTLLLVCFRLEDLSFQVKALLD